MPDIAANKHSISCNCRGQAQNGELGFGPNGKKSSANPDKVVALEGLHTHQVACGIGHTLFLVQPDSKQVSAAALQHSKAPDCNGLISAAALASPK